MAVYKFPNTYFSNRLSNIDFKNYNLVLDAACGEGDWLPALGGLNTNVLAFDYSQPAIVEANKLLYEKGIKNVETFTASMLPTPIKDNTLDAIFCFDSLMFVNPIDALNEFSRILKSKGKVYLSVNGIGWILKCILYRGIIKSDISKFNMGLRITFDTLTRLLFNPGHKLQNTVFTKKDLIKIARLTGFEITFIGYEGEYKNHNFQKYSPCFPNKYLGLPASLEAVLEKHE